MIRLNQFACFCGAQSEGEGTPPLCFLCDRQMYQWRVRMADYAPFVMGGKA